MQIRHVKTLMPAQAGIARPHAAVWSPNNKRLALCDSGRFVNLFDETGECRDKFALKQAEVKGPRSFFVSGMAFSPDSVKIAVSQTDCIVYVYRIGLDWGEKKVICNKFAHSVAATAVVWPTGNQGELLVFGGQDGKVKVGVLKTNKSQTLYAHGSAVVSLACSHDGNQLISGHLDFSIFQYAFDSEDGTPASSRRIAQHSCVPYCISWGEHIAVAGQDCVVVFYDRTGHPMQSFDYKQTEDKEASAIAFNPAGQTLAVAAFDKLRLFNFNLRSRKWEEGSVTPLHNAYSIPVLTWKCDGSRLITGTVTGAVDMFDACLSERTNHERQYQEVREQAEQRIGEERKRFAMRLREQEFDAERLRGLDALERQLRDHESATRHQLQALKDDYDRRVRTLSQEMHRQREEYLADLADQERKFQESRDSYEQAAMSRFDKHLNEMRGVLEERQREQQVRDVEVREGIETQRREFEAKIHRQYDEHLKSHEERLIKMQEEREASALQQEKEYQERLLSVRADMEKTLTSYFAQADLQTKETTEATKQQFTTKLEE